MRKNELAINAVIMFAPFCLVFCMLIGVSLAQNWPLGALVSFFLSAIISLSFLVYAKLPNLREGRLTTFGTNAIQEDRKKFYYFSYFFLLVGLICSLGVMTVGKL